MFYDICTTPAQLKKLGEWVDDGPDAADVELAVDDRMLVAEQGDDRTAWDLGGEEGSEEYIAVAPLDPTGIPGRLLDTDPKSHERLKWAVDIGELVLCMAEANHDATPEEIEQLVGVISNSSLNELVGAVLEGIREQAPAKGDQ